MPPSLQEGENEELLCNTTAREETKSKLLSRLFFNNDLNKIDKCTVRRRVARIGFFDGNRTRVGSFEDVKFTRKQRDQPWDGDNTDFKYDSIRDPFPTSLSDRERKPSPWLIPVDHKIKYIWDFATVVVSFVSAFHSHASIRDRSFGYSPLAIFCEAWFLVDIVFNFFTQIKTGGIVYKDWKSVWARYLTTWFVVDVVSLIPWERHYVKPIVEIQKRRNFWQKSFFRTRAVVRVTGRVVKGRHYHLFGKVAKATKPVGVGARRLLHLLIKYLPKYVFFIRRMKGIVVMRILRQIHHLRKLSKDCFTETDDSSGNSSDNPSMTQTEEYGRSETLKNEEEDTIGGY